MNTEKAIEIATAAKEQYPKATILFVCTDERVFDNAALATAHAVTLSTGNPEVFDIGLESENTTTSEGVKEPELGLDNSTAKEDESTAEVVNNDASTAEGVNEPELVLDNSTAKEGESTAEVANNDASTAEGVNEPELVLDNSTAKEGESTDEVVKTDASAAGEAESFGNEEKSLPAKKATDKAKEGKK